MPKRLEWSARASHDLARVVDYYAESVSPAVSRDARDYIGAAIAGLGVLPVLHRPGKHGTRECVLKRFPYTILYRATTGSVRIVRILHQAQKYFN